MQRYYVGLGANLGDRLDSLQRAVDSLQGHCVRPVRCSRVYETDAMYVEDQPAFLNAVAELYAEQTPARMLATLMQVEAELGRVRTLRYGPRTLDLDIVAADGLVVDTPDLQVPHPRMHERAFVLRPLCDLAPQWTHPHLGRSARELLSQCEALEPTHAPALTVSSYQLRSCA